MPVLSLNGSNPFAVTGIGLLLPARNSQIINIYQYKEISFFNRWERFRRTSDDAKTMLVTTKIALDNAGIDIKKFDRTKVGIIFATTFGSFLSYESFEESVLKNNLEPHAFSNSLASSAASAISIFWRIKGPCITFSVTQCAEIDAIIVAAELLKNKICDIVLTGGWLKLSKTCLHYFAKKNSISESAVVIVMESLEHLQQRKHYPYTIVKIENNYPKEGGHIFANVSSNFHNQFKPSSNQKIIDIKSILDLGKTFSIPIFISLAKSVKFALRKNMGKFLVLPPFKEEKICFLCKNTIKRSVCRGKSSRN